MSLQKVVYQAHATATGGRDGRAVSSDNVLDVKLATPKEMGGAGGVGTNPEQLFAAGYSACFLGALKFVAGRDKVAIPDTTTVQGTVGFGPIPNGFGIEVDLVADLPGVDAEVAKDLIAKAHIVCPYSHAMRTSTEVAVTLA